MFKGKCIIFSAPSGSGKTTLVNHLLNQKELNLSFSISATTRQKRDGEVQGKDYFFKTKSDFKKLIINSEFLEYEEVYEDVFYGTLESEVIKQLETQNVIFDIDVIGGIRLKEYFNKPSIVITKSNNTLKASARSTSTYNIGLLIKSLIDKKNAVAKELMEFKEMDSEISLVDKEVILYQSQCLTFGKQLYELRSKQVPVIEKKINKVLQTLSMGHANFKIDLNLSNEISRYGIHDISLLISVNNTSKYYPLHQFSSGGELSRVALAMKYISSSFNSLSTLIFDEIDSGISGKVASEVGYLLKEISKTTQVINITHLPQVAAIAKYHLNVSKNDLSGEMETEINYLRKEDRIQVLAKMLGGDKTGKAALNNALELLN